MTKRERVIQFLRQRLTTAKDFAAKADRSEVQFQYEESAAKFQAALALIADLTAEVEAGRNCVEPDPIYGWNEPRHLDAAEPGWLDLAAARTAVDAWDKEASNGKA